MSEAYRSEPTHTCMDLLPTWASCLSNDAIRPVQGQKKSVQQRQDRAMGRSNKIRPIE